MGQRRGNNDIGFKKWKGIVTEQNIGQYEAEAALDADNVEFLKDGTVQRRLGFEQEAGGGVLAALSAATRSNAALSHFLWEDINGIPGLSIRALQLGSTIRLLDDIYPVSQATVFATINLEDYASGSTARTEEESCQYAAGAGVMIIVARGIEPIKVTVANREWPPQVVVQEQPVLIRWDRLEGEVDANPLGPVSITHAQEFDLRNSGWPFQADCSADQDGKSATIIKTDPAAYFKAKMGRWPKVSILYSALRLAHAIEPAPLGSFAPWEVDKLHFGNTIPPKGHYITPAWSFDSRALMEAELGDVYSPPPASNSTGVFGSVISIDRLSTTETRTFTGSDTSTIGWQSATRLKWVSGDNVTGTWMAISSIEGRGQVILATDTANPIKIGDRYELSGFSNSSGTYLR